VGTLWLFRVGADLFVPADDIFTADAEQRRESQVA
jgi:hypothetical protein